jgi:hypothetical protein
VSSINPPTIEYVFGIGCDRLTGLDAAGARVKHRGVELSLLALRTATSAAKPKPISATVPGSGTATRWTRLGQVKDFYAGHALGFRFRS